MTDTLNIATLLPDDIDELVALVNSAYRGETSKKGWTTEADLLSGLRTDKKSIEALLEKTGAVILKALNATGKIEGCVYLHNQGLQMYLGMLTVMPDKQLKGTGKQLLIAAESYARTVGCAAIVMTVLDVRYELIDWYKRKGYLSTGEIKPFPNDPSFGIPRQPLQFITLEKKL